MDLSHKLQHIGIIPDGNRRWATEQGKPKIEGHTVGAKNIGNIAEAALASGVAYLTIWLYSTENLSRSKVEVAHLMYLSGKITDYIPKLQKNDIRVRFVGDLSRLPGRVQKKFREVEEQTKDHTALTLTFATAYGGRDDMVRAVRRIVEHGIEAAHIDEELVNEYMDLSYAPPIDLVIRTGGQQRLSGFFPWQTVYSELYYTDVYWPAFGKEEFEKAVEWFEGQERRGGR